MSFIPMILGNYHEPIPHHLWRPRSSNWDHVFGLGLTPEQLHTLATIPDLTLARRSAALHSADWKSSIIGKEGFQVCMDIHQFQPSEITVKTIGNTVIVEGKHEEREDDHGFITRNFTRKYVLPEEYDIETVVSSLSSDGILTVKAPKPKKALEGEKERIIHIQQTGPAHLNVKDNHKDDKEIKS